MDVFEKLQIVILALFVAVASSVFTVYLIQLDLIRIN